MNTKYLGSAKLNTSETKKENVWFFEVKPEIKTKDYVNHHILLADCSGSMFGDLNALKEKIKETLEALLLIPNSYVSVISYSDHNESEIVLSAVKCDKVSFGMADVFNTIEKELYIKSLTVISEPLEKSISICKSLGNVCDKHHIALFTDGCVVPSRWGSDIEKDKCKAVASICNKEGIYLNAIGFGQYYDRSFLKSLIDIAGNGAVLHIDKIKDYFETILGIIKKVNSENTASVEIKTDSGKIFNISSSKYFNNSIIKNFNDKNIFAVIGTTAWVDGELLKYTSDDKASSKVVEDFYYSLARFYANEEDFDNYEFIVKLIGDTHLYESTNNCYSFTEKGFLLNKVTELLDNPSKRFSKGKKVIVEKLEDEPICILEILKDIQEDSKSQMVWYVNTPYHRITQKTKTIEDNVKFIYPETGFADVTSISIGSEKLNIGIKVKFDGIVRDSISKIEREASVFRDFNIVNGGNINVPYINARLSKKLLNKFTKLGIATATCNSDIYNINLEGIRSVNKRILKSMSMSQIVSDIKDISQLKCMQWAYNQIFKQIKGDDDSNLKFSDLSLEEKAIRESLRINEKGVYSPEKTEKSKDDKFEIYPSIHLVWDIVKFPETKTKEESLNALKGVLQSKKLVIGKHDKQIYDELMPTFNTIKDRIREKEFNVNCVRIASAITGKSPFIWEDTQEKEKKTTDAILKQNMVVNGKVNIAIKNVDGTVIEQKKWIQLIKCS